MDPSPYIGVLECAQPYGTAHPRRCGPHGHASRTLVMGERVGQLARRYATSPSFRSTIFVLFTGHFVDTLFQILFLRKKISLCSYTQQVSHLPLFPLLATTTARSAMASRASCHRSLAEEIRPRNGAFRRQRPCRSFGHPGSPPSTGRGACDR